MKRRVYISGIVALLGAALCAQGEAASVVAHVTESDVAATLKAHGIEIRASQISLPADLPVRSPHPQLEPVRVEHWNKESSRVLLRCADLVSCIPFYAVIQGLTAETPLSGVAQARPEPPSSQPEPASPVLVKKGAIVTLQIVAPDMLITLPVICQQNGRQGDQIRVSSTDRKKSYTASVVNAGLLRSAL